MTLRTSSGIFVFTVFNGQRLCHSFNVRLTETLPLRLMKRLVYSIQMLPGLEFYLDMSACSCSLWQQRFGLSHRFAIAQHSHDSSFFSVVWGIKSWPLENDSGPRPNESLDVSVTFGTSFQRFISHFVKCLKFMTRV